MAPADPNATMRLKVFYTGDLGSHVMLFHRVFGASESNFIAACRAIIAGMTVLQFTGVTWSDAQLAQEGDPNFFPIDWAAIAGTSGTGPAQSDGAGKFLQFGGRGPDGRRVKWYVYETYFPLRNDMRYGQGESDEVDDVVTLLVSNSNLVGSITGVPPSVYSYANIDTNDYLVHKAR